MTFLIYSFVASVILQRTSIIVCVCRCYMQLKGGSWRYSNALLFLFRLAYAAKEIKRFDLLHSKIHFSVDSYQIERQILKLGNSTSNRFLPALKWIVVAASYPTSLVSFPKEKAVFFPKIYPIIIHTLYSFYLCLSATVQRSKRKYQLTRFLSTVMSSSFVFSACFLINFSERTNDIFQCILQVLQAKTSSHCPSGPGNCTWYSPLTPLVSLARWAIS